MARKGLRKKLPQLRLALQGQIRDHHRFLLRQLLEELRFTEEKINELDQRIQQCMLPHHHAISLWTSMPGIRMRALNQAAWAAARTLSVDYNASASKSR
jgi:transposase